MGAWLRLLGVILVAGAADSAVTLRPSGDTAVPVNSLRNVSYICESSEEEEALLWVVAGAQVWSSDQEQRYAESGLLMERDGRALRLVVTPLGREELVRDRLPLMCSAYNPNGRIGIGESSPEVAIVLFEAPGPVRGLELTYSSESELRLQWASPEEGHPSVLVSYSVTVTNTVTGATELVCSLSLSLSVWWAGPHSLLTDPRVWRQQRQVCQ
jgi:hypothetical protein